MAIKIIPEHDIYLTQREHEKYQQEYSRDCMMMAYPPSFEEYVKQKMNTRIPQCMRGLNDE